MRIDPATIARAWTVYLTAGLAALAAYFVAFDQADQKSAYDLLGVATVGAIFVGIRLWRPARKRAWMMLAVGAALHGLGNLFLTLLTGSGGVTHLPFIADAAYIAGDLVVTVGMIELARGRGSVRDRVLWVDAFVVAAAASIIAWVLVIRNELTSAADVLPGIAAAAYFVLDIVQITVLAHLILGGRRTPAVIFLGLGIAATLAADTVNVAFVLEETQLVGRLVEAGWLLGHVAIGTAALHPSMARSAALPSSEKASEWALAPAPLLFLTGAALTGPLVIALQAMWGEPPDTLAFVIGQSAVSLLVLCRVVLGMAALRGALLERQDLATELAEEASHDQLTGLANRRLFLSRLEDALARPAPGRSVAVLFLDLDRLKAINDTEGHDAGDVVLAAVARKLRSGLRSADTVARLGGDEFGIVLAPTTEGEALGVAERINALLGQLEPIGIHALRITASVGVALAKPGDTAHDVLRNADHAMYQAKIAGGRSYACYSEAMQAESDQRLELQADLLRAVERSEFVLHYQPIVDLGSGAIVGLEALVRWEHPARGLLLPGAFLDLAGEAGLIIPLGRWVFREAVRQAGEWQSQGLMRRALMIDINVAARQLADPRFPSDVASAIAGSGMGAGRITVELTETELIRDPEAVARRLAALRKGGLRVAIDDFGTAYASMVYLVNFPVDGLKIDRQFVRALEDGAGPGRALVASMVGLTRQLGIWAIAEGVETETQARALRELGCDYAQGFLFSRPLPASQIAPLLESGAIELRMEAPGPERRRISSG